MKGGLAHPPLNDGYTGKGVKPMGDKELYEIVIENTPPVEPVIIPEPEPEPPTIPDSWDLDGD